MTIGPLGSGREAQIRRGKGDVASDGKRWFCYFLFPSSSSSFFFCPPPRKRRKTFATFLSPYLRKWSLKLSFPLVFVFVRRSIGRLGSPRYICCLCFFLGAFLPILLLHLFSLLFPLFSFPFFSPGGLAIPDADKRGFEAVKYAFAAPKGKEKKESPFFLPKKEPF